MSFHIKEKGNGLKIIKIKEAKQNLSNFAITAHVHDSIQVSMYHFPTTDKRGFSQLFLTSIKMVKSTVPMQHSQETSL